MTCYENDMIIDFTPLAKMSKPDTPEAKELRLVGNVELRFAMITTDSAMEKALNTYLAPLLLKLASEHVSVRNKVSDESNSLT